MFFIFQYCINTTQIIMNINIKNNGNLYFRNTNNNIIIRNPNKDPIMLRIGLTLTFDLNFDNFIFIYLFYIKKNIK